MLANQKPGFFFNVRMCMESQVESSIPCCRPYNKPQVVLQQQSSETPFNGSGGKQTSLIIIMEPDNL
jgi:hypothetical protein